MSYEPRRLPSMPLRPGYGGGRKPDGPYDAGGSAASLNRANKEVKELRSEVRKLQLQVRKLKAKLKKPS